MESRRSLRSLLRGFLGSGVRLLPQGSPSGAAGPGHRHWAPWIKGGAQGTMRPPHLVGPGASVWPLDTGSPNFWMAECSGKARKQEVSCSLATYHLCDILPRKRECLLLTAHAPRRNIISR